MVHCSCQSSSDTTEHNHPTKYASASTFGDLSDLLSVSNVREFCYFTAFIRSSTIAHAATTPAFQTSHNATSTRTIETHCHTTSSQRENSARPYTSLRSKSRNSIFSTTIDQTITDTSFDPTTKIPRDSSRYASLTQSSSNAINARTNTSDERNRSKSNTATAASLTDAERTIRIRIDRTACRVSRRSHVDGTTTHRGRAIHYHRTT
jgi:hypothetical protein